MSCVLFFSQSIYCCVLKDTERHHLITILFILYITPLYEIYNNVIIQLFSLDFQFSRTGFTGGCDDVTKQKYAYLINSKLFRF